VAGRLRELRKAKQLTPHEMAEKLLALKARGSHLGERHHLLKAALELLPDDIAKLLARIRHYESGRADLPQDLFPAWAKVLGVTESDLLPPQ
jgi:transcriptional regulator with XRE-family HTH domain